jgi:protein MPE1
MPASLGKNRGTAQNYIVGTLAADALGNEHRIEASAKQALLDKQNRRAGVPGIGGAGGAGSLSRRFDGKGDEAIGNAQAIGSGGAPVISTGNEEEDRRIAAFFEQSGDQWERTQEDMSL